MSDIRRTGSDRLGGVTKFATPLILRHLNDVIVIRRLYLRRTIAK
jgi:hypothetical protein